MKLTKEILDVLKYHDYITFVVEDDALLKKFDTVEALIDAGFVTEVGVLEFLSSVFNSDGVNQSAEVSESDLEKQAEEIVTETEKVEETETETETEKVEEPVTETKPEEVVENPKPKRTTTRKSTKKES